MAFSFITGRNDFRRLRNIQDYARVDIQRRNAPTAMELFEVRKLRLFKQISEKIEGGKTDEFYPIIEEFYQMGVGPRDLCAALLQMNLPAIPKEDLSPRIFQPKKEQGFVAPKKKFAGSPDSRTSVYSKSSSSPGGKFNSREKFNPKDAGKSSPKPTEWEKGKSKKGKKKEPFNFYYN